MDIQKAYNFQIEYLRMLMPDDFVLETNMSPVDKMDIANGIIYYQSLPCAVVVMKLGSINEEESKRTEEAVQMLMRQMDMPYVVLFMKDSWHIFPKWNGNQGCIAKQDNLESFFETIKKTSEETETPLTDSEIGQFVESIKDLAERIEISDDARTLIGGLEIGIVRNEIILPKFELSYSFSPAFEQKLFAALVGIFDEGALCRYTTLNALFRTISDKKASMCSITCMNDKSECYYVDKYLNKGYSIQISQLGNDEVKELNQYFILSCSVCELQDSLFMWQMYGDEAKGVCLKYEVAKDIIGDKFQLAKVSYAKEDGSHPALDFISECMQLSIRKRHFRLKGLTFWKHFFKPHTYKEEREVRLLYQEKDMNKYKWIKTGDDIVCPVVEFDITKGSRKFPLILNGVILGPKSPENDTNASQLRLFKEAQNLEEGNDQTIAFSKISNYR